MAPETRARLALIKRKRALKLTQAQIAAEMGVSQAQVSDYLLKLNRPGALARERAARSPLLKLRARWWLTPEEGGPSIPAAMAGESEDSTPHPQGVRARSSGRRGGAGEVRA